MPFFGVCYSPYHRTNSPPPHDIPAAEVDADMKIIKARGFTNIRTYAAGSGDSHNVARAGKYGLKVGLGVWIDNNVPNNTLIDQALTQALDDTFAHPGANTVADLIIGNEVNRTDDKAPLDPAVILNYIKYAKQQLQLSQYAAIRSIRVTSCFSGTVLQFDSPVSAPWANVIDNCDGVVYLTVYPWYAKKNEGAPSPDNITNNMNWSWDNGLKQVVARGKKIVIAEIGWPSAGGDNDHSPTTPDNERINYQTTKRFLSGATAPHWALDTYWFEMFDEPWKTKEGAWGPHWGLYTSGLNPQPKFAF
ncbi:MAG TPA: glycosyl hydrolase family 17 protein [Stellaceae bacterium]|nr:glycosyl hydrolase family 17 protein [Stellaceae bacterium]